MAGDDLCLATHLSPVKLTDSFCLKQLAGRTLSDPITPAPPESNNVVKGGGMQPTQRASSAVQIRTQSFFIAVHGCNPAGGHCYKKCI